MSAAAEWQKSFKEVKVEGQDNDPMSLDSEVET